MDDRAIIQNYCDTSSNNVETLAGRSKLQFFPLKDTDAMRSSTHYRKGVARLFTTSTIQAPVKQYLKNAWSWFLLTKHLHLPVQMLRHLLKFLQSWAFLPSVPGSAAQIELEIGARSLNWVQTLAKFTYRSWQNCGRNGITWMPIWDETNHQKSICQEWSDCDSCRVRLFWWRLW